MFVWGMLKCVHHHCEYVHIITCCIDKITIDADWSEHSAAARYILLLYRRPIIIHIRVAGVYQNKVNIIRIRALLYMPPA